MTKITTEMNFVVVCLRYVTLSIQVERAMKTKCVSYTQWCNIAFATKENIPKEIKIVKFISPNKI